jgi:hypothetical protein
MRPYKVFLAASLPTLIAASCRLYLRHYCRLDSSSHRTTCGITANLSDLYSGIRCHFHTPVGRCCYESSMRPYKVFLAASLPTLIAASCRLYLRHYCRLDSSSHRTACGITANLSDLYSGIRCHFHTPVGLCCYESSMRPYKVFLAASLPTLIAASFPTRFVVW